MATFPLPTRPARNELTSQRGCSLDERDGREIVHDLMNYLTVIDLCVFQLRATVDPFTLTALERTVEKALRSAKSLALTIGASAAQRS